MFVPEMVLTKVQQGRGDPSWRVYYGTGSPLLFAIILGLLAFLFAGFFEFIGYMTLMGNGFFGPANPSPEPSQILTDLLRFGLVIPLIAAIAVGIFTWYRVSRAQDSLLVLLPEGVVECKGYSNPSHRSWQVLDYADVVDIQLRVWATSSSSGQTSTTWMQTSTVWMHFRLDIQKRNGEEQRWSIDSRYGPPSMIAQSIIEGHARYVALHPQVLWTQ